MGFFDMIERITIPGDSADPCFTMNKQDKQVTSIKPGAKKACPSPIALSWISENIAALTSAGWNRSELYRRGRLRYPFGWGIAWLSVWTRKNLSVHVNQVDGTVIFTFVDATGRQIVQTASKEPEKPLRKQ